MSTSRGCTFGRTVIHPCALTLALALACPAVVRAQHPPVGEPAMPTYRLVVGDLVEVTIFDEPNLSVAQRIDAAGQINLTLVGPVVLAGRTVREAEEFVAGVYVENRILRRPMATVRVLEYALREVSVNGEVNNPGMLAFPKEVGSLDIVELISRSGGLTRRANGRRVQVTRIGPNGEPFVIEVNVDDLIERGRGVRVVILPGDVLYVPARGF
jgi:polysaccharide export outer membrane protein